ncbi:hypothetical protein EYF80_039092 [Liparis tanakae]|uniref:Uncharacterized protein n=1 Tax=Liparis tanakae TaxID=230148 RepID=A0A4Z2GCQ7_9TELE|nr:hypothetical protein EYF80_039092 [Liparis tanakae]
MNMLDTYRSIPVSSMFAPIFPEVSATSLETKLLNSSLSRMKSEELLLPCQQIHDQALCYG